MKKMIKDTIEISLGGVAIHQANQIDEPYGNVLGTTIGAGLVKKKSKGMF